jgi:hypothetical protein
MPNQTIKTPCVGLCSTVYGDLVCRGCKRFHHEVINWIARGARVINNLEAYGMVLMPEFRDWNLPELRDAIDREFFLLSEAHYQRYIAPGFLKDAFGG